MIVKLGVIGLSPGNGHPYSWSAIINGYDPQIMQQCDFSVIPEYLSKQKFPQDFIQNAKVTHIWTQNSELSDHIAKATYIKTVCLNIADMIGQVDAVLLARDDSENHMKYALPFLNAGIPIYIDKPLATNLRDANALLSAQKYPGQIFTCSALKYASELIPSKNQMDKLGKIHLVQGMIPKDWNKYAIHLIDPILKLPINKGRLLWSERNEVGPVNNLLICYSNNCLISLSTFGNIPASTVIKLYGERGKLDLVFSDTFSAFKSALERFINNIISKNYDIDKKGILEAVTLIELGRAKI